MLNQSLSTLESNLIERSLASSHARATLPVGWQTPLPAPAELSAELANPDIAAALLSEPQSEPVVARKTFRNTKIIATLGPATENGGVLRGLLEGGISVFRINLACLSREATLKAVYAIRSISTELQRPVSLLLDTRVDSGRAVDAPALTEEDWADLRFGLECGVDWLAVSAGRDGQAVRELRTFLAEQKKNTIGVLARIERPAVQATLDQIVQEADGIILTGENPASECPAAENFLVVQKCVSARKPAILAAGLPAKLSAALSAQPDTLMLTEETSVGPSPLQNVLAFDRLIREEESKDLREPANPAAVATEPDQSVAAAVRQAGATQAEAIVIITRSGQSAIACAALRPQPARVFVFTPDVRLARRLRLRYALEPIVLPFNSAGKTPISAAEKILRERKLLARGAKIVVLTDSPDPEQPAVTTQWRELT